MKDRSLADNFPLAQPKIFADGEPLSAEKLNDSIRASRRHSTGITPPQQLVPIAAGVESVPASFTTRCQVQAVSGDYIVCRVFKSDGTLGDIVRVAKPWTLRALATRDIYTFTDYPVNGQERTATSFTASEVQVVLPKYRADDIIFAETGIVGGTGASFRNTDGELVAIEWQDKNIDARAWSRKN